MRRWNRYAHDYRNNDFSSSMGHLHGFGGDWINSLHSSSGRQGEMGYDRSKIEIPDDSKTCFALP